MQLTSTLQEYRAARRRVFYAFLVLTVVLTVGSGGYWWLGWVHGLESWTFRDCVYMTAITISTVGYTEALDVGTVPFAREWTVLLIVFGISANLWVISSITSFFVEGDFVHLRRYRRQVRLMNRLENHYIVCGVGTTGLHVANELLAVGHQVVVIDSQESRLEAIDDPQAIHLVGDATDDAVLEQAGIGRAAGVVATLDDDKTNMFVVVSARQANPGLRIVAKAVNPSAGPKLQRAGANQVVSPNFIGGMRIASELIRPEVVRFLDDMLRGKDQQRSLRIEEAILREGGEIAGKTLAEARLPQRTGALVIAIRSTEDVLTHAPPSGTRLEPGMVLILIGRAEEIRAVRELAGS